MQPQCCQVHGASYVQLAFKGCPFITFFLFSFLFWFSTSLPFSLSFLSFLHHDFLLKTTSEYPQRQVEERTLRNTPLPSSVTTTSDLLSSQLSCDSKALTLRDEIPVLQQQKNNSLQIQLLPLPQYLIGSFPTALLGLLSFRLSRAISLQVWFYEQ